MYFWISCVAAGVSLCLIVWLFIKPVALYRGSHHELGSTPLLAAVWPWVSVFAVACNPFLSWRVRQRLSRRIMLAGLGPRWRPQDIVGLQCLCAVAAFLAICFAALWMLEASHHQAMMAGSAGGAAISVWPWHWLASKGVRRQEQMLRELPFLLDVTTLCVEAGLNMHGALHQAAKHGPEGPLRAELRHALSDIRTGMPRGEALAAMSDRTGLAAMRSLVIALAQAEQMGMSLGPLLRSQSDQRRSERFLRAEKLALEAPVKMLFPMVFCIFPCTFLILAFPVVLKLTASGF